MQYLESVTRTREVSWYRLRGDFEGHLARWVVSTPQSIAICNKPEVCGVQFSRLLREAMVAAISSAPFRPFLESVPSRKLCVMNFLRGSLNFDLRNVLLDAVGSNYHTTCFMSSQRSRKEGRWVVKEDMYRKVKIPDGGILLLGDVVATGVTVRNGFDVIEQHLVENKHAVEGVVFFTIGSHKLEKALESVHQRFAALFPNYRETHVVYLEGKFRLVDSATRLMIAIQGTDLIKLNALLAPEFELSQYSTLSAPLERCCVYDAGSRAFDVSEYLADVIHYWRQVKLLAKRGYTLREALQERWPESDYGNRRHFFKAKRDQWRGVPEEFLAALWKAKSSRWTQKFTKWAATSEALLSVAEERLATLETLAADATEEGI